MRVPSCVGSTACTGGHLMHCCCVGTVQLIEISMRPRIGVLDLRVAVVLDPPHRWRAGRRARLKTGRRLVVQRDPVLPGVHRHRGGDLIAARAISSTWPKLRAPTLGTDIASLG